VVWLPESSASSVAGEWTSKQARFLAGVSDGVLQAVAGALRLDDAERAHLFDLARASRDRAAGQRRRPASRTVRPAVEWMVNAMTSAAAFVVNSRQDILTANHLGRAFYAPVLDSPGPANMACFTYLDPRARDFFTDWNRTAKECVAALRTQAGRDPLDRGLSDLIGELSTHSAEFAALWATHDVRLHRKTEKNFNHPVAGELTLRYERLAVDGDPGLEIYVYLAEPGSRSAEAFSFLASYADGSDLPGQSPVKKDA
jgi:MmyB-like transcription regulator ligand binding domain